MPNLLAEISDKLPTVSQLWVVMLFFSVPALIGIIDKRLALFMVVVAWLFSTFASWSAIYDAFLDSAFSSAVQKEMGSEWILHSIASAWLPATAALAVVCWHLAKK